MAQIFIEDTTLREIGDSIREAAGTTKTYNPKDEMPAAIRSLKGAGGMNDEIIEFNQVNDQIAAYLTDAEASYTFSNYRDVALASTYSSSDHNYDDPLGYDLSIPEAGTIYFMDETDGRLSWKTTVQAGTYTAYNLIPDHIYRWYVIKADGTTVANGKLKPTGKLRQIYCPIGDNCRDMGGWQGNGGKVKYGMMFRGFDGHGQSEFIDTMRNVCGIRAEIDLQEENSGNRNGISLFGDDVEYNRFSLDGNNSYSGHIDLNGKWWKTSAAAIQKAMECVVLGSPVYIHCSLGRDRTGTICYMLQAILGMDAVACDIGYELTALTGYIWNNSAINQISRTTIASLRQYLEGFNKTSVEKAALAWCERAGIPAELINQYRARMIDGTPEKVVFNNNVKYNLSYVTSSNTATSVVGGSRYEATMALASGAKLIEAKVMMGGADITSTAWDANTLKITIPKVTGDIDITVEATVDAVTVTYNLTNIKTNNVASIAIRNESYNAKLTPDEYYTIGEVSITMGGVDVTSSAYVNGIISIASVTGDIIITASGIAAFTNVLRQAIQPTGQIYNNIGYQNGHYCTSVDGTAGSNFSDSTDTARWVSGLMPIFTDTQGNLLPIYVKGWTWDDNAHTRFYCYTADYKIRWSTATSATGTQTNFTDSYDIEVLDAAKKYVKITPKAAVKTQIDTYSLKYWRISMPGTGDDVIITLGEPIEEEKPYTNVIRSSQALNSTEIYNTTGFKNGYYQDSSAGTDSANANDCVTGLIPYKVTTDAQPTKVIYIKGFTGSADASHNRISLWNDDKTYYVGTINFLQSNNYFDVEKLGDDYYKLTPKTGLQHSLHGFGYVRFSFAQPDGTNIIITIDEPIEDVSSVVFEQVNSQAKAYLLEAKSKYTAANHGTLTVAPNYYDTSSAKNMDYESPVPYIFNAAQAGTLTVSDEDGNSFTQSITVGENKIYNFIPNKKYTCIAKNASGKTFWNCTIVATGALRMINSTGSLRNMRDLGGWQADGGTIKYGKIFRGGQLHNSGGRLASAWDITVLHDFLKIRYELDLRNVSEIGSDLSSVLGSDVTYDNTEFKSGGSSGDVVAHAATTAGAVKQVMQNAVNNIPTYIHCAAGADRTGVICYLLEMLLGVAIEDADKDYELTVFYYGGGYQSRLRTGTVWKDLTAAVGVTRDAVVSWAIANGITYDEINAYRAAMINGTPAILSAPEVQEVDHGLLTQAESYDSTEIYNDGKGYKNGYYISNNGTTYEGAKATYVATGYIPFAAQENGLYPIIHVTGAEWDNSGYSRLFLFGAVNQPKTLNGPSMLVPPDKGADYWTINKISDTEFTITPNTIKINEATPDPAFIRISAHGVGESLSVTYDTNTASVSNNLLDTVGFYNGKYASEPIGQYGNDANYYATGVIKWDVTKPMYIKGWNPAAASHSRFYAGTAVGSLPNNTYGYNNTIGNASNAFYSKYTVTQLGTEYVKIEAPAAMETIGNPWYVTISLPGTGNNTIITIGEPIENATEPAVDPIPASDNLLAKATVTDGETIFNTMGYQDGKYCSTNAIDQLGEDSAFFATGLMPFEHPIDVSAKTGGDVIYIKGAIPTSGDNHCRLQFGHSDGTTIQTIFGWGQRSGLAAIQQIATIDSLGSDYVKITIDLDKLADVATSNRITATHFRLSLRGSGDGVVIHLNKPIEDDTTDVYNNIDLTWNDGNLSYSDGKTTSSSSQYAYTDAVSYDPDKKYRIEWAATDVVANLNLRVLYYDASDNYLGTVDSFSGDYEITNKYSNAAFIRLRMYANSSTVRSTNKSLIKLSSNGGSQG